MNNCKAFLDFFDKLVTTKGILQIDIPEEVKDFYDFLRNQQGAYAEKPIFTDLGLQILEYMQMNNGNLKAKDIAEGMNISSRKVSGAIRKLVSDDFINKFGQNPVVYNLTEKGLNFNIEEYKDLLEN